MRSIILVLTAAILGLSATGCSENTVQGTASGHEFGKIETAVWYSYEFGGEGLYAIYLADYPFTCEELQEETLTTATGENEVGVVELPFARTGGTDMVPSTEPATYVIMDPDGQPDGTLLAGGMVRVFTHSAPTTSWSDASNTLRIESGDVTIEGFDAGTSIFTGTFTGALSDGTTLSGRFSVPYCQVFLPGV